MITSAVASPPRTSWRALSPLPFTSLLLCAALWSSGCAEEEIAAPSADDLWDMDDARPDPGRDASMPDDGMTPTPQDMDIDARDMGHDAATEEMGDGGDQTPDLGTSSLIACVLEEMEQDPFEGACANPAEIDFGALVPAQIVTRRVRLDVQGQIAVTITEASIDQALYGIEWTIDDRHDASGPQVVTLPYTIEGADAPTLFAEITLVGELDAREVPDSDLVISWTSTQNQGDIERRAARLVRRLRGGPPELRRQRSGRVRDGHHHERGSLRRLRPGMRHRARQRRMPAERSVRNRHLRWGVAIV